MLRTVGDQPTLWESLLPVEALVMPAELVRVDALLDDRPVLRAVSAVLPRHVGAAVDPDRDVSAVDVLEVPLPARVRDVVSGGDGLDHVAAVLSDPARWAGAASDDVDEDHDPLRADGGRRVERGVVGQGGRGQGVEDEPGACRHHRGRGQRRLPVGLVAVGQGRGEDGQDGEEAAGDGVGDAHQAGRQDAHGAVAGPVDQRQPAAPQRRQARRGASDQR